MKKIFIIILMFLMFVSAFSFEKVYLDENEYKIYKKSVSEMPKTAYNAIVDFMKHDAIFEKYYNNLNSNFIIKHTFLFDPKNISKKEFDKDYILYTTCLTGMDIFTLFNKKENKAFILNKNSNNEQLSYLVNFTFDGGLLSILKSKNLEYFYKAIFDLTYGVANVIQKLKVYIFDFIIAICHLFVRFEYIKNLMCCKVDLWKKTIICS